MQQRTAGEKSGECAKQILRNAAFILYKLY
jgi:hypothetical protein